MDRDAAGKINVELRRAAGLLDRCAAIAKEHAPDDDFQEIKQQIGGIMGEMYFLVFDDLWKRFPELEPEGVRKGAERTWQREVRELLGEAVSATLNARRVASEEEDLGHNLGKIVDMIERISPRE